MSPYLGVGVAPRHLRRWRCAHGKGVFVLAATSNPEAPLSRRAQTPDVAAADGETVAARVARDVSWRQRLRGLRRRARRPIGFVIGATVDRHGCSG